MIEPKKVSLICAPTPLHKLEHLSSELRVSLWIKRDDLTGFAGGGNKGRKIEYLIAEAVAEGVDTIVCCGGLQSNFVRQLGAACSMYGIHCDAVVMELPYYASAGVPPESTMKKGGNVILDRLFGIELHVFPNDDWEVLTEHMERLAEQRRKEGRKVKVISIGGSSAVGAYSFVKAAEEVGRQIDLPFDFIVTASSSGSTHAGLTYGFHGTRTHVIGISADPDPDDELATDIVELCQALDQLTGQPKNLQRSDVDLRMEYCGQAYGIPSPEGTRAIELFARKEGIVLDPIYSGKAAAGLMDLISKHEIAGQILFWHTGGFPTLFASD